MAIFSRVGRDAAPGRPQPGNAWRVCVSPYWNEVSRDHGGQDGLHQRGRWISALEDLERGRVFHDDFLQDGLDVIADDGAPEQEVLLLLRHHLRRILGRIDAVHTAADHQAQRRVCEVHVAVVEFPGG